MKVYGPYLDARRRKARRFVQIVRDDGTKRTQSYARFVLEQHLGRPLRPDEDADHIDGDTLNDDISNLRPLPRSANRRLGQRDRSPEMYQFKCPVCGQAATKLMRVVRQNWSQGHSGPYCSSSCASQAAYIDETGALRHKTICPRGHLKEGWAKGRNGKMYRICRTCNWDRRRKAP
jgi:hypothetical protein